MLHGPVNVGNQPWALSRAERRLGLKSDLVVNYGTWLNYPADLVLGEYGNTTNMARARRVAFGMTAPLRYDVLHYYFGRTFLLPDGHQFGDDPRRDRLVIADLELAKRLGRKVFMTLQGCDVRLAAVSNRRNDWTMCAPGRCSVYSQCLETLDRQRQGVIDRILPLCDRVFVLNPELNHMVPNAVFMPYANVPIEAFTPVLPTPSGRPRIVHAPSNGPIKGTPMILGALEALRSDFDFELILVEGKPHAEALEIYRSADLAIDQILAGWYGGFAVEMMALGKPVACHIRDADLGVVPERMRRSMPILQISPASLVEDLAAILRRRAEWPSMGEAARRYVERWHSPDIIAKAMVAAYRDDDSRFDLAAAMPAVVGDNRVTVPAEQEGRRQA